MFSSAHVLTALIEAILAAGHCVTAAALRARVAAKAAQQSAVKKVVQKPKVVRPDDEHRIMGGIGAHRVRDNDDKLLAELLKP